MTERTDRGARWRGRVPLGVIIVGLVAAAIGAHYGPHLLSRGQVHAAATSAAEAAEALPGVTSADATVDDRFRSRRHGLRFESSTKPRGEVTMNIVLAPDLTPEQLAEVMKVVRHDLTDPELARHAVAINYTQTVSNRRIFDGWGVVQRLVARSDEELNRIAGYALDLPDGAWFDLDPATFEQGQFTDAGPPLYGEILGAEVHEGFTVGVRHDSASVHDILDEAARLTGRAADVLDGPTAVRLEGPGGATVLTTTDPVRLIEALRQIATLLSHGDASDALIVSFEVEREWTSGGDAAGTVNVRLTLGAASACARDDDLYASFVVDAATILDQQALQHTIDYAGCS